MKHLRWVPLAFLAGQHGFAIFAPYAALMIATAMILSRWRRRPADPRPAAAPQSRPGIFQSVSASPL
ncbi:MAG TPA: hypothetical protein VEA69_06920 [Tepidisphaeraceae bacterium]|nr:hypothetical protein [Tepidisphaeraceae bacterium]